MNLATRILIGMIAGATLGTLLQGRADLLMHYFTEPTGTIWLNLLLVMMLPLACSALILGMLGLDPRSLAKTGGQILGLTLGLSGVAVAIGIAMVTWIAPGAGVNPASLPPGTPVEPATGDAVQLLVSQFPSNVVAAAAGKNLVPVLVFAVLFGLALARIKTEETELVKKVIEAVFQASVRAVEMVLVLAPLGVGALTFNMAARGGLSALAPVAWFVLTVLLALAAQMFIVYPLTLALVARRNPWTFFVGAQRAILMAFSTASSAATLPTSLEVAENELKISPQTARFVLTVGATGNQNGTALFEGVAVLFLAQMYGIHLDLAQQLGVVGVAMIAGVGTAGVPGGALPVISAVCVSLGMPDTAVGAIIGVDRLLDMCRTTLNVTGDLVIAASVRDIPQDA